MSRKAPVLTFYIISILFIALSMAAIIVYSNNKTLTLAESRPTEVSSEQNPLSSTFKGDTGGATIPVSDTVDIEKARNAQCTVVIDVFTNKSSDITLEGVPLAEICYDICNVAAGILSEKGVYVCMPKRPEMELLEINSLNRGAYVGVSFTSNVTTVIDGWYNRDFVIPGFGNKEAARVLLEGIAAKTGINPGDILEADEEDILNRIEIPSARIDIKLAETDALMTTLATVEGRQVFGLALAQCIEDFDLTLES